MSRGVRDLRELISQSRQTPVGDSGDELVNDTDDNSQETNQSCNHNGNFSVATANIKCGSHVNSVADPDCIMSAKLLQHVPSVDSATTTCLRLRYNNPRPLSDVEFQSARQLHELPKCPLLPAVKSNSSKVKSLTPHQRTHKEMDSLESSDFLLQSGCCVVTNGNTPSPVSDKHMTVYELDDFLQMFDRSVVRVWLEQTKRSTTDISDWCAEEGNFVRFAHFWLSEFPDDRRCSMFEFEYDLLRDKIASGCKSKQPSPEQVKLFLIAILHEFPEGQLTGQADAYVFLEHLESLAESHKRDRLLAALLHSSRHPQHYDCLLAVRSYAIVSIWSAILDRYRSGLDSATSSKHNLSRPSTARISKTSSASSQSDAARSRPCTARSTSSLELQSPESEMASGVDISSQKRIFDAIRLGYEDVVQYLLETHKVSLDVCDADNKTVIFHAVTSCQPGILRYLLRLCKESGLASVVNAVASSGNTPLHAAVNRGDVTSIRELLSSPDIDVNAANHECDDVTPLLVAAMHGHADIVKLLLDAGADWSRTVDNKTAHELAIDFDNIDVVDVLEHHTSQSH